MSLSMILAVYTAIFVVGTIVNWFWSDKVGFDKATNTDYIAECMDCAFHPTKGFLFWKFFIGTFKYSGKWYSTLWNKHSKAYAIYAAILNIISLPISLVMVVFVGIYTKVQARCIQKALSDSFAEMAKEAKK